MSNELNIIKDPRFHLPDKKSLLKGGNHFEAVPVDVTESPVERPPQKKLNYSGKKKRHTQKTQIIADKSGRKILCTAFDKGRKHNFRLLVYFKEDTTYLADTGYQGCKDISHYCRKISKQKKTFCLRFNLIVAIYNLNLICK